MLVDESGEVGIRKVHLDTLACMTGVTRFLERRPPAQTTDTEQIQKAISWIYDKTEDDVRLLDSGFWAGVDYAIAEQPEKAKGRWQVLDTVDGFAGFTILTAEDDNLITDTQEILALTGRAWHLGDWAGIAAHVENLIRVQITKGWWIRVKKEPKLRILKRLESVPENEQYEEEVDDELEIHTN